MKPERWKQIDDLFDQAVALPQQEQHNFLLHACDDPELRQEVEDLLAMDRRESTLLDDSPFRLRASTQENLLFADDIIADRFRISSFIGRGGMGEVYEAYDLVLDEQVALKVIRPFLGEGGNIPGERLKEVLFARRVTHPGVSRVHDLVRHTTPQGVTLLLISMELVRGVTLAEYLDHHTLTAAEAFEIGAQLAAALDAAHARRICHGDLKPANVLIEAPEHAPLRVVLTDFGLARALDNTPVVGDERMMGTPKYMAPEQLRGTLPSIRSDLYSYALVMEETLAAVRQEKARPGHWDAVFTRALSPDPKERYSCASDIINALNPLPMPWWRRGDSLSPRGIAALVALLIIVALVATLSRFYLQAEPTIDQAATVLLTETRNQTGLEQFDGASEVMRTLLSQSRHFELMAPTRIAEVLGQMQRDPSTRFDPLVAREVALRENVPVVVYSTLERRTDGFSVDVTIESVRHGPWLARSTWRRQFDASNTEAIFGALREGANWVRRSVGEAPKTLAEQDRDPTDITTSSWSALQFLVNANKEQALGHTRNATLLLDEAVRLDPKFASAHMRLGDLLLSLRRDREAYAAWEQAIRLNEQRGLTSQEQLRMRGRYYEDTGQLENAAKAYRIYLQIYPTDPQAAVWLATVLSGLDQAAEAETWLLRAVERRPEWYVPRVHLTTTLLDLGRIDEATVQIQRLREYKHENWATWLDGLVRFLREDVTGALEAIEPLKDASDTEWRSRAVSLRAAWMIEQGHYQEAMAELRLGIAFDDKLGIRDRMADKWLALAELQVRTHDDPAAIRKSIERALAINDSADRVARAGAILASIGELDAARTLGQRFANQPDVPRVQSSRNHFEGHLALASGQFRRAVRLFENADAIDSQYRSRLSLCRALVRAGDLRRAAEKLEEEVGHVARRYRSPDPQFPGVWADALVEYASVWDKLDATQAARIWNRYRRIRSEQRDRDRELTSSAR